MPILTPEERIGSLIAGRYRIESILGEGGMGVVLGGKHELTGRKVAIKLLHPTLVSEPEIVERFFQEAKAAAALNHPNVVDVLDLGVEDGDAYLILEYLEGRSLGEVLKSSKMLSPEQLLPILLPVIDALGAAHERGIIHRDLKPDNIFVSRDLRNRATPKVLDFGIAKLLEGDSSVATRTGAIVGTPQYMSPEQAQGKKDVGPECDIWSMGVLLYECLTGTAAFAADSVPALLLQVCMVDPPPLLTRNPLVHEAFGKVVARALAKEPTERYRTMDQLGHALTAASIEAGITLSPQFEQYFEGFRNTAAPPAPTPRPDAMMATAAAPTPNPQSQSPTAPAITPQAVPAPSRPSSSKRSIVLVLAGLLALGCASVVVYVLAATPPDPPPAPTTAVQPPPVEATPDAGLPEAPDPPVATARAVQLTSTPTGALVRSGDVLVGTTPLTIELEEAATMPLEVSREGYHAETVTLDADTGPTVDVSLRRRVRGHRRSGSGGDDLAPR